MNNFNGIGLSVHPKTNRFAGLGKSVTTDLTSVKCDSTHVTCDIIYRIPV